jgi:hypothetical protein
MTTLEYDLRYVEAAIDLLKDYLLSKDIYRPIQINAPHGTPPYPQLTLGNMLLARTRAEARAVTPTEKNDLRRLEAQIEAIHSQWRVAWESKAADEYRARLRLWSNYLNDYSKDPEMHADRYRYEVGRRVLLELLTAEARELPSEQLYLLTGLDKLMQAVFVEGAFIWEEELARVFPSDSYWYLYGHLRYERVTS